MKLRALVAFTLLCAACGGNNNTPSSALQIAGHWTGSATFTQSGQSITSAWQMDLTQTGNAITGPYTADAFNGTIAGSVTTTSFTGTFTFNGTLAGVACTGSFTASGPGSATAIVWTSTGVQSACSNTPQNISINAHK